MFWLCSNYSDICVRIDATKPKQTNDLTESITYLNLQIFTIITYNIERLRILLIYNSYASNPFCKAFFEHVSLLHYHFNQFYTYIHMYLSTLIGIKLRYTLRFLYKFIHGCFNMTYIHNFCLYASSLDIHSNERFWIKLKFLHYIVNNSELFRLFFQMAKKLKAA